MTEGESDSTAALTGSAWALTPTISWSSRPLWVLGGIEAGDNVAIFVSLISRSANNDAETSLLKAFRGMFAR